MTSDDKIKEYYKQQNLMNLYTDARAALENILHGHKMCLEHPVHNPESYDDVIIKQVYEAQYNATIHSHYISVDELRGMTISEIVDFLK